eukprot:901864-Alexandrium_andersonii.AAC.1
MSASLVGSEMCIRDRGSPRGPLGTPSGHLRDPPSGHPCPDAPCTSLGGPVSYTHLTLPTICSV